MKDIIIKGMVCFAVGVLAPLTVRAQVTLTYVSSLEQLSVGSGLVGSDSWLAEWLRTGSNPGGYALDSIELAMTPSSGAPNGFEVMLYAQANSAITVLPGSGVGTLNGSSDPAAGGNYTYTASGLTLSPDSDYFIVVTAGTAIASGAYAWSLGSSPPASSGGWVGTEFPYSSNDGLSWNTASGNPQFALTATAVPEPDALVLLALSGLMFLAWRGRSEKARPSIVG